MTSKKQQVKEFAREIQESMTVNGMLFFLTGYRAGARWHKPRMEVSKSTVRRALDEMVQDGELTVRYAIGHCFDEALYEVKK